jgi:L-iditol 2-dehydrogenase
VLYSGICGTDKHTYRGETLQYAGTPHEREITYPLICGHENVGIVVATGGEVMDSEGLPLRPGDRVVPAANVPCGTCVACRNNHPYYLCEHLEDYGNSLHCGMQPGLFGGWAEYMYLLPRTPIFRVPDDLPSAVAVLTEPMAVTHGLDTARMVLANSIGARFAETVGRGPDIVVDCSGVPRTFAESLHMVRSGGVVVEAGAFVDLGPVAVNPNSDICTKNVAVLGVGGEVATAYLPSMRLMASNLDRLPLKTVVTHRLALEDAQSAVELAQSDSAMKVVIAPHGTNA